MVGEHKESSIVTDRLWILLTCQLGWFRCKIRVRSRSLRRLTRPVRQPFQTSWNCFFAASLVNHQQKETAAGERTGRVYEEVRQSLRTGTNPRAFLRGRGATCTTVKWKDWRRNQKLEGRGYLGLIRSKTFWRWNPNPQGELGQEQCIRPGQGEDGQWSPGR